MPKDRNPAEVVETIRQSIEVSQRRSRRVRAHRFKELFGFQALSAQRRELIERLLADAGIVVQPALGEAGRDDWLVLSMPTLAVVPEARPDPRPSAEWFDHLQSVRPATEREVEMHFASPLFRDGLGYREEQEAAGYGIQVIQGVRREHVEADLVYFADDKHDPEKGQPLVLVECKRPGRPHDLAAGQARSYSLWVLPAYYVVTDAETVSVWDYQGAIAPDVKVMEFRQSELDRKFDDLYARLNPAAVQAARKAKIGQLAASR
jgi:hypothetical protein